MGTIFASYLVILKMYLHYIGTPCHLGTIKMHELTLVSIRHPYENILLSFSLSLLYY